MPTPYRRALTVRALLVAIAVGAGLYVAVVGGYIVWTLRPAVAVLQVRTEALGSQYEVLRARAAGLGDALVVARRLSLARVHTPADRAWGRTARAQLVRAAERSAALQAGLLPAGSFAAMRTSLAAAAGSESRLAGVLLETLDYLDLGDFGAAETRLAAADTTRMAMLGQLDESQRLGLEDLVARERVLAGAADRIASAVLVWVALGATLLALAMLLVRRRLYLPLAAIDRGLTRVERGELEAALPVQREDELGRLTAHFNQMTGVLRARSEEEHRRRTTLAERFGRILDHSFNEIYVVDATTLRVVQANRGAQEALGYTPEQFGTMTLLDVIADLDEAGFRELVRPLQAGAQSRVLFPATHRRRDGSRYPVESSLQLWASEDPAVFVAIAQDATERRRREALQSATQHIAEAALTAPTLQELYVAIHRTIAELMPARNFYIALHDPENDLITFPYFVDEYDQPPEPSRPGRGLTEYVLRTGQPVLATPEVSLDLERRGEVEPVGAPSVDWLGVPLVADGTTIGVLVVQTYSEGVRFGDVEMNVLKFVSTQVAMAIARKRAAEALRRSEERYRALVEGVPDVIFALSPDGVVTALNSAFEPATGFGRGEWLGRPFADLVHLEDAPLAFELLQKVLHEEPRPTAQLRLRTRRGDYRVGEFHADVQRRDGEIVGILGIVRDITERRRAEAELLRLNRLYRVLSLSNQMIVRAEAPQELFDEACRIAVQEGAFRMAWAGVVDETTRFVKPVAWCGDVGTYLEGIRISVNDIPEGRGPTGTALREGRHYICRDIEREPWMEPWREAALAMGYRSTAAFPIRTAGAVTAVFVTHSGEAGGFTDAEVQVLDELAADISYALDHLEGERLRKRAEEALRASETKYRSLVEHAAYGIYRSTVEGRFVAVNPALVKMLGYGSEAEVLALHLARDLYADPEEHPRLVARYHDVEHIEGVEVRWRRKDGTPITVRLSGRPLRDEAFDGFEMVVEDVTARQVLEEQFRQAQKMEAVGQLAGGVAHDFNNLLTAVLSSGDLLRSALPADSPLVEDVDTISTAARRGAELTRKLLAFSRHQPLALRTVSLGGLAEAFTRMVRRVVPEDVEVVLRVEARGATIRADQGAVEQVLMNLVTNARDAMPTGGKLLIEVGRSTLDPEHCEAHGWGEPGEYATLVVSDTGVGMDAETQRHIFEPFFTNKPAGQGTGLGMSTVYGLVKQHQGFVHVYSEPGQGTTVRVYLPAVTGEGAEIVAQAAPEVRGGTEAVLLVEDDEAVRRAATRVLKKFGYRVLTAADGGEALEIMQSEAPAPDLIISDVVMPRISGPQLLSQLREAGPVPKILFTSGYTARDVRERTKLEPGMPFLAKPWTVTDLLRKVREVLDEPAVP